MWTKIVDWYRKRKIFDHVMELGIDVDGDIITYKGTRYFVHVLDGRFNRV